VVIVVLLELIRTGDLPVDGPRVPAVSLWKLDVRVSLTMPTLLRITLLVNN